MSNPPEFKHSIDPSLEIQYLRRENAYLRARVRELEKSVSDAGWEREYYRQIENEKPKDGWL